MGLVFRIISCVWILVLLEEMCMVVDLGFCVIEWFILIVVVGVLLVGLVGFFGLWICMIGEFVEMLFFMVISILVMVLVIGEGIFIVVLLFFSVSSGVLIFSWLLGLIRILMMWILVIFLILGIFIIWFCCILFLFGIGLKE